MSHIFTTDTKRFQATFTDYAPEGETGDVIDADSDAVTVTIYNGDQVSIATGTATRSGVGVYYYDWTAPSTSGTYYIEFKGLFLTKPQLERVKVKVKFKPDPVEA